MAHPHFPRLAAVLAIVVGTAVSPVDFALAQTSTPSAAAVPASPAAVQATTPGTSAQALGALRVTPTNDARKDAKSDEAVIPCKSPPDLARFDYPLIRTARKLASGEPIKIVAIGSSSTQGAGATTPAASYPSRLSVELAQKFPRQEITVLNRGIGGEVAADMLARFETAVIAERPDLVLWQAGTNSVLRDQPLSAHLDLLREGVARLKANGADVVLIDPQFAPRVLAKPDADGMVAQMATVAKETNVDLFRRFALMRYWRETQGLGFDVFLSPDELHMNDWSYACVAKVLGDAIVEASTRAPVVARTPSAVSGQRR